MEKQAYRVAEFCQVFGICKTATYNEIKSGRLKFFKVGRMTLISKTDADAWLKAHQEQSLSA